MTPDDVIAAIYAGTWSTADLVRIAHAVASQGNNTTSILGQYGEERVAAAFNGTVGSFAQKAYDVQTPEHGDLQVKTYSVGKRPGNIRSFTHDVVTVEVDPATGTVTQARLYSARDLYAALTARAYKQHAWAGGQADRFERGWTIARGVPFTDVTDRF